MDWFEKNKIRFIKWPPQFPDLSPIDNLWSSLKIQLDNVETHNTQHLLEEASRLWLTFAAIHTERLLESMLSRVAELLKNRGSHTH
jgi:hypothetical protein